MPTKTGVVHCVQSQIMLAQFRMFMACNRFFLTEISGLQFVQQTEKNFEQKHRVAECFNVNTTHIRKISDLNFGRFLDYSKGFRDLPQFFQPMSIEYFYQITLYSF
jgi:hypothetical protein